MLICATMAQRSAHLFTQQRRQHGDHALHEVDRRGSPRRLRIQLRACATYYINNMSGALVKHTRLKEIRYVCDVNPELELIGTKLLQRQHMYHV
jgi:hypothetical protein